MLDLGATLFHKVGLGDQQHEFGYEGEFDPWLAQLWPSLKAQLSPDNQMLIEPAAEDAESMLPPLYCVEILEQAQDGGDLLQTLDQLPAPLGAMSNQVSKAAV